MAPHNAWPLGPPAFLWVVGLPCRPVAVCGLARRPRRGRGGRPWVCGAMCLPLNRAVPVGAAGAFSGAALATVSCLRAGRTHTASVAPRPGRSEEEIDSNHRLRCSHWRGPPRNVGRAALACPPCSSCSKSRRAHRRRPAGRRGASPGCAAAARRARLLHQSLRECHGVGLRGCACARARSGEVGAAERQKQRCRGRCVPGSAQGRCAHAAAAA